MNVSEMTPSRGGSVGLGSVCARWLRAALLNVAPEKHYEPYLQVSSRTSWSVRSILRPQEMRLRSSFLSGRENKDEAMAKGGDDWQFVSILTVVDLRELLI